MKFKDLNNKIEKGRISRGDIQELADTLDEQCYQKLAANQNLLKEHLGIQVMDILEKAGPYLKQGKIKIQEPLKVALVGEYSTGKTTALKALFRLPKGYRLPADKAKPTTGNVTEIRVHFSGTQHPDFFSQCSAVLFDHDTIEVMLMDYYKALNSENYGLLLIQEKILVQLETLKSDVRNLLKNKHNQLNGPHSDNEGYSKLSAFFRLLLTIDHYKKRFGAFPDPSNQVSLLFNANHSGFENRLGKLIILPSEEDPIASPEKIEQQLASNWQKVPETLNSLVEACTNGSLDLEALRAIFLLVSRVILNVESKIQPEFQELDCISFLDFPGLGSANFRDKWLCKHEMKTAHLNLFFISGEKPALNVAYELLRIIAEDKGDKTIERIIPVINQFDLYDNKHIPQESPENMEENWHEALNRLEQFWAFQQYGDETTGFVDFIRFLEALRLKKQSYQLISAFNGIDHPDSGDQDTAAKKYFNRLFPRYKSLLKDIDRIMDHSKELNEEQKKHLGDWEYLSRALNAYVSPEADGGISPFRQFLFAELSTKGIKMVCKDALDSIEKFTQIIEDDLIIELKNVTENNYISDEELEKIRTKDQIRHQWSELIHIYGTQNNFRQELVVKKTPFFPNASKPVFLSDLAWRYTLNEVLKMPIWHSFLAKEQQEKRIPLSELNNHYKELMKNQIDWMYEQLTQSINDTLEIKENEKIKNQNEETSIIDKQRFFSVFDLEKEELNLKDREKIFKFLFPKRNNESLSKKIIDAFRNSQQFRTSSSHPPFDPDGVTLGSPIEIMKLQRQMILTIQSRFSEIISFFNSEFFWQIDQLFTKKGDDSLSEETLSQLAEMGGIDPNLSQPRRERKESLQRANEILNFWQTNIQNI